MGRRTTRTFSETGVLASETIEDLDALKAVLIEREHAASVVIDGETISTAVMKADTPKRYTLGVAVAANQPDVAVALDGFRDFLRPDTVEASAWGYMAKSREVGIQHSDGTEGHGVVVESYIYRGPDWTLVACDGSTQVIKAGDWLLGTVWDEQTWPLIEAGILNGHSVDGKAQRAPVTAAEADELRSGRGR